MGPWIWKCFTRGHNIMLMDTLTATYNGVDMVVARRVLGDTQNYAKKINLAAMTPSDSSYHCSTTYCLRNPGQEYLIYQPNSGAFTVNLAAGTYDYEWFNPKTGTLVQTGTITASTGNRSFIPPFSDDALLYLSICGNRDPAAIFGTKDACSK